MFDTSHWYAARDGDARALALFRRHYSYKPRKDGKTHNKFVGPGEKLVLLTQDCKALFAWRKFKSNNQQDGVNCAVFRNEGPVLSSTLIREASDIANKKWPGERQYTYVNPHAVQSKNPGYCFKIAGWCVVGVTKRNKLLILEYLPQACGEVTHD